MRLYVGYPASPTFHSHTRGTLARASARKESADKSIAQLPPKPGNIRDKAGHAGN